MFHSGFNLIAVSYLNHIISSQHNYSLAIRRINEIAPTVKVSVQKLETRFLVHRAHADFLPFVSDAHGAELERRNVHRGIRGQQSVSTESCWWWW